MANVCFNIEIEGNVREDVVLFINGMGSLLMDKKKVESGKSYFRKEIVINWEGIAFPYTLVYSYSVGGKPYNGQRSRTWYHGGDGKMIHINDSFSLPSPTNKITVLLHLVQDVKQVYFCQKVCHFGDNPKLPMTYDQSLKMWRVDFEYTPGLFFPLIYSYEFLESRSKLTKTSRIHRLSITGPLDGQHIQICDNINDTRIGEIPHYFPPIETCTNAIDEVNVQTYDKYYCIPKSKAAQSVAPTVDCICAISSSCSHSKSCLSFDLSNVMHNESCSIGTFNSIKAMADFVLSKGASLLHVTIRRLRNAAILDPIHADYRSSGTAESEIRGEKETQILETFEHGVKSPRYQSFKQIYFESLKQFVANERAFYVQYVCWCQLIDVSDYCSKRGVRLVTDLSITDPSTMSVVVKMNSLCFNGIKMIDASAITCTSLEAFFGHDCWEVIQSTYFVRDGRSIKPKPELRNSKLLMETFNFFDVSIRDQLVTKLCEIMQCVSISVDPVASPAFLKAVTAQESPAVLFLDESSYLSRTGNTQQIFVP